MRPGKPNGLFGHGTREAVLAAVHVLGPATIAEIARTVGTNADHAARAVRHFERYGVVRVNRNGANRSYATMDWTSPLYEEARTLAARFAALFDIRGEPRVAHRWGAGRERRPIGDYVGLFGSPTASRVLLNVASAGETDPATLTEALVLEDSLVREVIARLERDGLVRRRADGRRRPVSLDPAHPAATEIANLLRAVLRVNAEHGALTHDAGRVRRKAAAIPHRDRSRRTPENAAAAMLGFLNPRYARALVALASGPLTGAELTRRLGLSRGGGRLIGRSLTRASLVRETPLRGARGVQSAFGLDPAHLAAAELKALLVGAARRYGLPSTPTARTRAALPVGSPSSGRPARWPPDHHGRLALLLAMHRGADTVDALAEATGWARHVARPRALGMVRAKLAVASFSGTVLVLAPDPAHPLAAEIEALLSVLSAAGVAASDLRTMYGR